MSLRAQILALITVPFIALAAIGGLKAAADWERFQNARATQAETRSSVALMEAIHHLQVERGLSAAFLSSGGNSAAAGLNDTRIKVDTAMQRVPDTAGASLQHLSELTSLRQAVSDLALEPGQMGARYSAMIGTLLQDASLQLLHQKDARLAQLGAGLVSLAYAKEAAGQQRAAGAAGFGLGSFNLTLYRWFTRTGAVEHQLLDIAGLALREVLAGQDLRAGLAPAGLPGIRDEVLEAGPGALAPGYAAKEWFDRATQWVGSLRDSEMTVTDQMIAISAFEAAQSRQALIVTLAAVAASLIVSGAIGLRLITAFTRQFGALQTDLDRLARKEFDFEPAHLEAKTEIGKLSRAMEKTRTALAAADEKLANIEASRIADRGAVVGKLDDHLARLSGRDLECTIDEAFPEEYEQLRQSFNTTVATLKETIEQVISAASSIHNGATEISTASDDLSSRTESQAATLEETAAALEQLTASVKSSADGARGVEQTMQEARSEAEASGEVVRKAVTAMNEIEQSSVRISQIISVIDDIAFQTNLLALNAGVEAARAGEAGKGFAVVASEVRALAQRSADAATEIKALIGDSSKHVKQGVDLVGETGEALTSIVGRVNDISQLVSSIAEGAAEQSTGLTEINTGVGQLDQVTQQNAAMVEEATAAGHMLHSDAGKLAELMAKFKISGSAGSAVPSKPAAAAAPASATAHGVDIDFGDVVPVPAKAANGGWEDF
ncbi:MULTISPECIES: methyl-accepting chemotaxis protein [unclassified Leisingera]|uniref:methyl-accepting chemotaxis protein n=1 Tax=unclassified Leisingera TaxID=2614906 RepID=UPI00030347ED|nr:MULTISPECIES: methyl-accepting chemotaxis protein [unclassified Leisingera]KIC25458.1 chemotaxis protein [Leisingera sp. ANG-S3]KIC54437.1 chemotaxis protein [Leisingera sp. ANG-S]KID10742.1 chemotaxis protein [Leisingera sp. ANG1]